MSRIKLIIVFFIIQIDLAFTQDLNFEQISTGQGLSNSLVTTIIQDKQGFIWIGTEAGLNRYDGYHFKTFNTDPDDFYSIQGRTIGTLYEDHEGLLWITFSTGGLTYYNPKTEKFYNFQAKKDISNGLSDNSVNTIFEDKKGNIWIGTNRGLNKFRRESNLFQQFFETNKGKQGLINNVILSINEDDKGNILIGTEGGLSILQEKTQKFSSFIFKKTTQYEPVSIGNSVQTILQDKNGIYWFGTRGNGVFYCTGFPSKPTDFKHLEDKLINEVNSISQSRNGPLWISHSNGLSSLKFSNQGFKTAHFFNSKEYTNAKGISTVNKLKEDSDGNLWVAINGNKSDLYKIDKNLHVTSISTNKTYLYFAKNKMVSSIYEDKFGILWFGLFKAGIAKCDLHGKRFEKINLFSKNEFQNEVVYSIFIDKNGTHWIGTANGLVKTDKSGQIIQRYIHTTGCKNCPAGIEVASITQDKKGFLWLGFYDSQISRFDPITGIFESYLYNPLKKFSNVGWVTRKIISDFHGKLWFSSFTSGLTYIKPTTDTFFNHSNGALPWKNSFVFHDTHTHISSNKITTMLAEHDSIIWIGTIDEGLDKFNLQTGLFNHFKKQINNAQSLSSNEINAIYRDSKGRLWIGTGGGGLSLMHENTKTFTHYSTINGLSNNTVVGITEDDNGFLWLSTVNGISCFDPEGKSFKNFYKEDGFQSNEFNVGAVFKSSDGKLYFGSNKGVTAFFPKNISDNPFKPILHITGLRVYNKPILAGDTLHKRIVINQAINYTKRLVLNHNENDFTLEFTALHYAAPLKNELRYKLIGYDKDWKIVTYPNQTATYTGLPPGDYIFKIIGSNNDGVWNNVGTSMEIIILPPWYQTWWANLLLIIFIFSSLLIIYRIRTKSLRRQKKILEEKVQLRTQDLLLSKDKLLIQKGLLENKNLEIERIAQQLHEVDEAKLRFFTNISHELRTPLTLIYGPLEKLLSFSSTKPLFEIIPYLQIMRKHTGVLIKLVNQLLDLRRIDNEVVRLRVEKADLITFVKNLTGSFGSLAEKYNLSLTFKSNYNELFVFFDKDIIEKSLYNLISNALKFTPDGGSIEVICEKTGPGDYITISIIDSGIGISETEKQKVFQRFFTSGNSNSRYQGSGIGLALTKELLDIHKAEISVSSMAGKGAAFIIKLSTNENFYGPSSIINDQPSTDLPVFYSKEENFKNIDTYGKNDKKISPEKSKYLILIVEDNVDLLHFISNEFSQEYEVEMAKNGSEGFEKALKLIPDLIITDIMMPVKDGLQLCTEIRNNETTAHIPVIMLTAKTREDQQIDGLETGANDYITKPFSINILHLKIRNLLENRKKLHEKFIKSPLSGYNETFHNTENEKFLQKLLVIIEQNLTDPDFDGEILYTQMNMTRSTFYRKLKAVSGLTVNIFIRNVRLKRAAILLKETNKTIQEILYDVGFLNHSYFTKSFTEVFGTSPSKFKRNLES